MSRILNRFPERPSKRGRPSGGWKYPWHRWLDGRVHALTPGVHFQGTIGQLREAVHSAAKRRGRRVKTQWRSDWGEFVIQLLPAQLAVVRKVG